MYLAIDIGGTKTAVASFGPKGRMINQKRFATPADFDEWLEALQTAVTGLDQSWVAVGIGLPGSVGPKKDLQTAKHPQWNPNSVLKTVSRTINTPTRIANDATLAGLAESVLGAGKGQHICLYVTLSTGVGTAVIIDGRLDISLIDSEGGMMLYPQGDKKIRLEDMVSGLAFQKRSGQDAREVTNPKAWEVYAQDLGLGLYNMIRLIEPDVVIIGGGMVNHLEHYGLLTQQVIAKFKPERTEWPPLKAAALGEDSVLYGAYLLAKTALTAK